MSIGNSSPTRGHLASAVKVIDVGDVLAVEEIALDKVDAGAHGAFRFQFFCPRNPCGQELVRFALPPFEARVGIIAQLNDHVGAEPGDVLRRHVGGPVGDYDYLRVRTVLGQAQGEIVVDDPMTLARGATSEDSRPFFSEFGVDAHLRPAKLGLKW